MSGLGIQTAERATGSTYESGARDAAAQHDIGSQFDISVVICTRNRCESLRRTLKSVGELHCPVGLRWELIVVDNDSNDGTPAVVRSFAATSSSRVRYVLESRRGTSFARNRGIREAGGNVIAFIDDDMIVDPEWLSHIATETAKHPLVGMCFGQTRTMRADQANFAVREGDEERAYAFPCSPREPGSSNNMVLRRSAIPPAGAFDTSLGPGTPCLAAEDIDLTYRVLRTGGEVRYCPSILAYHDHARSSPEEIRSLRFAYGIGAGAFYCKHIVRRDVWATKMCLWEVRSFLKMLAQRGDAGRAAVHLAGLASGLWMRLGLEIESWMQGDVAAKENSERFAIDNRALTLEN